MWVHPGPGPFRYLIDRKSWLGITEWVLKVQTWYLSTTYIGPPTACMVTGLKQGSRCSTDSSEGTGLSKVMQTTTQSLKLP